MTWKSALTPTSACGVAFSRSTVTRCFSVLRKLRSISDDHFQRLFSRLWLSPPPALQVDRPRQLHGFMPLSGLTRATRQHGAAREIGHELASHDVYSTTISGNQFATLRPSSEAETVQAYLVRSLLVGSGSQDFALLCSFIVYQTFLVCDRFSDGWNVTDQKLTVTDS